VFGAPPELIESLNSTPVLFDVWPENADTLQLFLKLQTQWNVTAGGFVGLNYPGVLAVFEICGVSDRAQVFEDLQAMEAAALVVLNKKVNASGS
jgi:hypothetical protein